MSRPRPHVYKLPKSNALINALAEATPGFCALCPARLRAGKRKFCGREECTRLYNLLYQTDRRSRATGAGQARGEACSYAKLTAADVLRIRSLVARGVTLRELAQHFKVAQSTVREAAKGFTWAHVPRGL